MKKHIKEAKFEIDIESIKQSNLRDELLRFNLELEKHVEALIKEDNKKYKGISRKKYPTIFKIYEKHGGLCDLICNYFTIMKPDNLNNLSKIDQILKNNDVDLEKLENLSKTHILSLVSFIELIGFLLFKVVPNNILTYSDQRKLRTKDGGVNENLLTNKFNELEMGACVKYIGFTTSWGLPNLGHSMLICKISKNDYIFYDPSNDGNPFCEFYDCENLVKQINVLSKENKFEQVSFINNDKFMERVDQKYFINSENTEQNEAYVTNYELN